MDDRERITHIVEELRALIDHAGDMYLERRRLFAEAARSLSSSEVADLMIGARRLRGQLLGDDLFGEPAWDILLGLYSAHCSNSEISVSAATTFGSTKPTTGLRWIAVLIQNGMIKRLDDPDDRRRHVVTLTPEAIAIMKTYTEKFADWAAGRSRSWRV